MSCSSDMSTVMKRTVDNLYRTRERSWGVLEKMLFLNKTQSRGAVIMSEKSTIFQVCASPARVGVLLGQPSTRQIVRWPQQSLLQRAVLLLRVFSSCRVVLSFRKSLKRTKFPRLLSTRANDKAESPPQVEGGC